MKRALAIVLATLLGGCDACTALEGNVESHVDVPTTLGDLEDWARDEGYGYEVHRFQRPTSSGGACGHSPACVILLPILLADAMIPSTLQVGSATADGGEVVYTGVFDLRGRLVHARVRDGEEWREIRRLPLDELNEHPIVETARLTLDGSNQESERRATPILPQVDLVAMYAEELADENDANDRADLVYEQLDVIGEEMRPSVLARYRDADPFEDEEVGALLNRSGSATLVGREELLALVAERGGPHSSIAAVSAIPEGSPHAGALMPRVADAVCGDELASEAGDALAQLSRRGLGPQIAARSCESPTRTTLLHLIGGQTVADDALVRALHEDRRPQLFLSRLNPHANPAHRRVLVLALDASRGPTGSIAERLRALDPPSAEEASRAARVYASPELDGLSGAETRQDLLAWMLRADPSAKASAAQAMRAVPEANAQLRAAALAALTRDRAEVANAVRDLDTSRVWWSSTSDGPTSAWNEQTVVAWALIEAGCTREQIEAGARRGAPAPECP